MSNRVELETVFYETVADGVVLLTMNRPERGNGVVPEGIAAAREKRPAKFNANDK